MKEDLKETLTEIIEAEAKALDIYLWGLELATEGKRRVLRIFADAEGGVTVGQCARLSKKVGLALEVEDVMAGAYTLEVSSPGLDRKFFKPEQMTAYIGQEIEVRLHEPLNGARNFKGVLESVESPVFTIVANGASLAFNFNEVKTARLVFNP